MQEENRPLTAIRGIAALWVVAHHAQPAWAPDLAGFAGEATRLGYVAVDVFFVLSGFIMALVYRDLKPAGARRFWLKRVLRVYPLHVCIMAFVAVQALAASLHNPALPPHPWHDYLPSLLLLQSYVSPVSAWNPPSWSVGVELACYALFPLAMPLLRRVPAWALAPLLLLLAGVEWTVLTDWNGAIVGPGAVLRGLAGFALGAVLSRLAKPFPAVSAGIVEALAAAGIAGGIAWGSPPFVALSAALLILVLAGQSGPMARALSHRWLVWLGSVSFSIYLLHAPLIGIMHHLPLPPSGWLRGVVLLSMLLPLSGLSWRYVEQPGRRLARTRRQPATGRWPAGAADALPPAASGRV